MLTILLPAAGQSSRMRGTDKLLMEVAGLPCLRTMATRALKATDTVIIPLRPDDPDRVAALAGLTVTTVSVPDHDLGMFASLRAGAVAIPDTTTAFMILPADMPGITANDIATLWAAFQTLKPRILRAGTDDGKPGHPIIFDRAFLNDFRTLGGSQSARNLLKNNEKNIAILPLTGDRARRDLDTPEDWAHWRAETPIQFS